MHLSKLSRRSFIAGSVGLVAGSSLLHGFEGNQSTEEKLFPVRKALPNPYVENGKPIVVIIHGTDYGTMLAKGMQLLGGFSRFYHHRFIGAKP